MQRKITAGGLLIVAAVARPPLFRRYQEIMGTEDKDTIVIGEAEIALARKLVVCWDPSESGAPALFNPSGRQLADWDMSTYRTAVRAAEVLLDEGELAPGRYEYQDPLANEPNELEPFASHRLTQMSNSKVVVDVTERHLLLLKNATCGFATTAAATSSWASTPSALTAT